jgi:Bacterial membrane protein YfhO
MTIATIALFLASAIGIAAAWNTCFDRAPWRVVALFIVLVSAYESTTLFTSRVDLPADLAFNEYPWAALGKEPAVANTGIVFTQIAPWTRVARDAILAGEWPLWNRYSACGAPLLANQQTAIFHPFTLAGVFLLSIGKSFTYTACLRLFTVLFFMFTLLRGHSLGAAASIYGAVAYAFSTFHVVWLLFPLGLATMMLPITLTGVQQVARAPGYRSFMLLTIGLSLSVLGGHPESAFWVWFLTAAYAAFLARHRAIVTTTAAFVAAAALTAFFWMPTVALLSRVSRTALMRSIVTNPPNHHLGAEWIETLVAPNILGTPQSGSWSPPETTHPAVLNDYGELSSGYAGILTLALAIFAVVSVRRREVFFFAGLMVFAVFTIAEVPVWRDLIRSMPVVGLTMHQRLRVFWALGTAVLAAIAIDAAPEHHRIRILLAALWISVVAIYVIRKPPSPAAWLTLGATSLVTLAFVAAPTNAWIAAILTFMELFVVTYRYNPSSPATNVYPATGAINAMIRGGPLNRIAAVGWSLLPDTPSFFGLEDVKSTDPISDPVYKRLMHGYLHVVPSYDEMFATVSEPFFDFLNIRYVYVPPGGSLHDARLVIRYAGNDGFVYDNRRVVPRYFLATRYKVNTAVSHAIASMKDISDFHTDAVVDHVPSKIASLAPQLLAHRVDEWRNSSGGVVRVVSYRNNSTMLNVQSSGWSLLASSDTNWPGWRAYINGERQPPVTVNAAFLGCFVPPGKSVVEFRYRPPEFELGLRISALTIVAIFIATMISMHRLRKQPAITE